ncbi:MAG: NADP-dependent isocitrate dehydrogenase [Deltaproteobacteria bacterium]|jgi:isocitrate dehydrogenase|nr:NADP-dependent isocitrate dehydrogenase [Deltaproteobacteria bacterium]
MTNLIALNEHGGLVVPDQLVVPVAVGDGVGPDIWRAAEPILKAAAERSGKSLSFLEVPAGEEAVRRVGSPLPDETLETFKRHRVSLKGPLGTPVGGGLRSLNVAIRRELDLYACVRPVKWLPGAPSPVKRPELVDMVIFRENTEDVYAGLEWPAGSPQAEGLIGYVRDELKAKIRPGSAVGLKPMSEFGSKRLVRLALEWALREKRASLTLVHKGNIMKFTEGGFLAWGRQLAQEDYAGRVVLEAEARPDETRLILKDRIADNMFMQTLTRPDEYGALAMPNLNGDYLSDCLAAQIGGLGVAPGANLGDGLAVFEATHGTAPKYAGQDKANPASLILSGAFMLAHLGWTAAAESVRAAVAGAFAEGVFTLDLARQAGRPAVSCSAFGRAVLERLA